VLPRCVCLLVCSRTRRRGPMRLASVRLKWAFPVRIGQVLLRHIGTAVAESQALALATLVELVATEQPRRVQPTSDNRQTTDNVRRATACGMQHAARSRPLSRPSRRCQVVACSRLHVVGCLLHVVCGTLSIARCPMLAVGCVLSLTRCRLHAVRCRPTLTLLRHLCHALALANEQRQLTPQVNAPQTTDTPAPDNAHATNARRIGHHCCARQTTSSGTTDDVARTWPFG
jgi:hypothetical protein